MALVCPQNQPFRSGHSGKFHNFLQHQSPKAKTACKRFKKKTSATVQCPVHHARKKIEPSRTPFATGIKALSTSGSRFSMNSARIRATRASKLASYPSSTAYNSACRATIQPASPILRSRKNRFVERPRIEHCPQAVHRLGKAGPLASFKMHKTFFDCRPGCADQRPYHLSLARFGQR